MSSDTDLDFLCPIPIINGLSIAPSNIHKHFSTHLLLSNHIQLQLAMLSITETAHTYPIPTSVVKQPVFVRPTQGIGNARLAEII